MSERRDFRLTKIICTLGPASGSSEMIERLANAGMNVARLNFSHGDQASHLLTIRRVRSLNRRLNHPIALLLDLQGPEIRTGEVSENIHLDVGETYTLTVVPNADPEERTIHVDYRHMAEHLTVGDRITVDNGLINLEVLEVLDNGLRCRVTDGGKLGSRKHINLPGIRVNLPSITEKDRRDILFGIEHDVDFIALSFVRSAEAVRDARRIIEEAGGHHAKIVSKIENQEGVDHFDEILAESDAIMVARGDLGVELEFEELPSIQREIARKCVLAGKPVIVATHLLESMIDSPMPTRAEVTDVANAVYEQVDAIMLSGETATGKHPERCVRVMGRIARRTEKEDSLGFHRHRASGSTREELARHACRLADSIESPAIVVFTRRGELGQLVASYRPRQAIIYAFTNMSTTRRKLWLSRSVVPFKMDFSSDPERTIVAAFERLRHRNRVLPGDRIVVVSDVRAGKETVSSIQVRVFE
ncbi:MAG: pyruvate kinase [Myxococcales bacterium]|nr:pyruvate kinase [Myxococcales bacterium]MDD9968771.1 pyruvate kinase [Myxococcales bacterium]